MSIFQIIVLILIVFVAGKAVARFYRREISLALLIVWLALWLAMAAIVIFPGIVNYLANLAGVGRGVDLVIYFSIFILFYALFMLNLRLAKIEKNITKIVRKIAVGEALDKERK